MMQNAKKQHKTTMFKPWFLTCFLCDVLVIEIEATEPTLGHLQEPIGKGHCTDLLLAVTVRAPGKRGYEDIRKSQVFHGDRWGDLTPVTATIM